MKAKSPLTPILAISGLIIIIAIIIVLLVMNIPSVLPDSGGQPDLQPTAADQNAGSVNGLQTIPNVPIAIQKQGQNSIVITNIGGPDSGLVSDFVVTDNGVTAPGSLGVSPGQSLTITTTSTQNIVVVTAHFKDGTSFVVAEKDIE